MPASKRGASNVTDNESIRVQRQFLPPPRAGPGVPARPRVRASHGGDVNEEHSKDGMRDAVPDELRAAREALRHANERMENMLESLSDGFCAVDHGWRITYINGRALEMLAPLHKTRAELTGRDLWDAFPELRGSQLELAYRHAMEAHETSVCEFLYPALKRWFE